MINLLDENSVFLQPGEFYFGHKGERISTLLGSCIAITLWHPKRRIGGMCHYMLPSPRFRPDPHQLNGKYAEDAMAMFMREVTLSGTRPSDYQAKIFGGGNMLIRENENIEQCKPSYNKCIASFECKNVACKNIMIAKYLLHENGFNVVNQDLGGTHYRRLVFELSSGDVWLRRGR